MESTYNSPSRSIANECAALILLKNTCENMLSKYETTLEEDKRILEEQALTYNEKNCIVLRMGEKEVLHYYINFAERTLKILECDKVICCNSVSQR